jgi:hypothetical protein
MAFIVFVDDAEIVCQTKGEVALTKIGLLLSPTMQIPHQVEEIFERRGTY